MRCVIELRRTTERSLVVAVMLCARALHAQSGPPIVTDTATVVVECRIGEVAAQVLEGRTRGDTLFLPIARVLALAGLDSSRGSGDRSLQAVSTLLRADVSFDPSALVVQVADSGTLPVSRRATRARMRALVRGRTPVPQPSHATARVSLAPTAVTMTYSAQRDGTVAVDAIARAFGGALDGAVARRVDGVHGAVAWTSVPDDVRHGTRIRIGALDQLPGAVGVLLTNAPLLRDDTLRVLRTTTAAAAGTELELFEDGELVAADSVGADSAAPGTMTRLYHPQRYGTHVLRLVAHDASGVAHESRWVESTPDALLPRGAVRYITAAGRFGQRPRPALMASVAYAPTDRVTLSLATTPSARDTSRKPAVHATLDARLGDASVLSVRREGTEPTTAELRVERGSAQSLVLRTGAAASSPILAPGHAQPGAGRRLTSASGSWRLPAHGVLDVGTAVSRSSITVATAASMPLRAGVVQGSIAESRGMADACIEWTIGALVNGAWLARLAGRLRSALLRMREERQSSGCGDSRRSVLVALPTGPRSALELSMSWQRARRPVMSMALRRRIGSILTAHAELTAADRAYATRSDIAGTVVVDRLRRRVSFDVDGSDASAVVEGTVYVDENGNGRRDASEAAVSGAVVRTDDASGSAGSAVSDADGLFVLAGLTPDRQANFAVDSVSVEDAGVVPTIPVSVVLTPRAVVRVDVALRRRAAHRP